MVIDAAMLFEIGIDGLCDKIIVIRCDKETIIKRSVRPKQEAELILKSQASEDSLLKKADFIINNTGTLEKTKKQVEDLWKKLK